MVLLVKLYEIEFLKLFVHQILFYIFKIGGHTVIN